MKSVLFLKHLQGRCADREDLHNLFYLAKKENNTVIQDFAEKSLQNYEGKIKINASEINNIDNSVTKNGLSGLDNNSAWFPKYSQFKNKPKEAIKHLLKVKKGDCINALYRKDIGFIDIVWGENDSNNRGFGLKHIYEKHGKEIEQLGFKIEDFLPIIIKYGNFKISEKDNEKIVLEGQMFRVIVVKKPNKTFLLSAFDLRSIWNKEKSKGLNGTYDGINLKKLLEKNKSDDGVSFTMPPLYSKTNNYYHKDTKKDLHATKKNGLSGLDNNSAWFPKYTQFKNKPKEAIKHLLKVKKGDCINALYRKDIGFIDIVWGENDSNNRGFGLKHIYEKHGKEIEQLGFKIEDFLPIVVNNGVFEISNLKDRILLNGSMFRVVISKDKNKTFVLSAFDLRPLNDKEKTRGLNGSIDGINFNKLPLLTKTSFSKNKDTKKDLHATKKNGLSGLELSSDTFKKMSVSELRKFTLQYYNENLKGKKTEIKNALKEVVFTSTAGRKILKPIYSEKVAVIQHLEDLIKNSTYNNWGERKEKDSPDVIGYLNFKAKILIDGRKRHVRISVILDRNRNTKLKTFEIGANKKSGDLPKVAVAIPKDGGKKPLLKNKDTKKGLHATKKNGLSGLEISSDTFKKMSVSELRKFTLSYYNENLKGKKTEIKNALKEVVFTSTAGRKIAKGGSMYKEKASIIEHLEELIKNSTYNNWGDRKITDTKDVLGYLNFKSKVTIDDVKRHIRIAIVVKNDRKTLLKNVDLGQKKAVITPRVVKTLPAVGGLKPLLKDKYTKKGLNATKKEEILNGNVEKPATNKNTLAYKLANKKTAVDFFKIDNKDIKDFLGEIERKEKESVFISLTGGQGSMKTRMCFQLMNAFAKNYKVGHASIEEHPDSNLYFQKAEQYIDPKALNNIEAPEVTTVEELHSLIKRNDVIVIDSFTKMQEIDKNFQVDKDLRKKYNGKLFIVIFQQTTDGKMRGGSKSQFDADIVLFTQKEEDYRNNYIYTDKNRYQNKPLDGLKYNIFSQKLLQPSNQATNQKELSFSVI